MSKKKKKRKGTATEAEIARRKRQSDSNFEIPEQEKTMEDEETNEEGEELIASEDYEAMANAAIDNGDMGAAAAYATLALVATLRESTFILADIMDLSEEDDDDG